MKNATVLVCALWVPALLIRLILMTITLHGDLLFIHHFPAFLSYHAIWDVYGYFGDYYLSYGFTYYPPLIYFLMAFSQVAVGGLNPDFGVFMTQELGMEKILLVQDTGSIFALLGRS